MAEPTHTARASLITKERSYSLGGDALCWTEGNVEGRAAYADIGQMRLITYGSFGGLQGQCTLRARPGGRILIRSHHYASLGNFEDRSATYGPFVSELARRIAAANPGARFIAGSTGLTIVWVAVLAACVVAVFFAAAALVESTLLPGGVLGPLAALAVLALVAWRMIRRSRQSGFDPDDIPQELLAG